MKNVIDWIKTNPAATASAVVALLGLLVIVYFYTIAAPQYSAEKSKELKQQLQKQKTLQDVPVPLPNEDPNAPPDVYEVVVNQTVIKEVSGIYSEIQSQYEDILLSAKNKNSQSHIQFLLGGNDIWPDASPSQFFDLYVRAAADYKDHFKAVFNTRSANNWNMPRMVAASPPIRAELERLLAKSAFDYISSVGAQSADELSQNQANQLFAEQRMKLMEALRERALSIHLYAQLPREEDVFAPQETDTADGAAPQPAPAFGVPGGAPATSSKAPAEYPFTIAAWAYSAQPPSPDQLWEGQVQLWVMRDIMKTIGQMNKVFETVQAVGPDGAIREEGACVINSPVKRLLKLRTLPGYVGLHNTGAAMGRAIASFPASPAVARSVPGGGPSGASTPSIYPAPPAQLAPGQATDRAVEHFGITPTGRVSNSVFDVRHTRLTIDIEAARLPAFIELLRETNFMTVIKAEITNLDEYELLREGYMYGTQDVVRADLIVESLWFRNWTADLMPNLVKQKLLIIAPAADPALAQ